MSLPDDVAQRLEGEPNASAFVAEAIRRQMNRETTADLLARQGIVVTEEGKARARKKLDDAAARMTPERWEELRRVGRTSAA